MRLKFVLCRFLVTASYVGFSPILPGTAGTLLALAFSWTLSKFYPEATNPISWSVIILLTTIVGIFASNKALEWNMFPVINDSPCANIDKHGQKPARNEQEDPGKNDPGKNDPGKNDPSAIVIDEVVGFFISILGLSSLGFNNETLFIGFFFFRFFDITKIWPISKLEKLPRGYGIMADDILAGIFANFATRLVLMHLG